MALALGLASKVQALVLKVEASILALALRSDPDYIIDQIPVGYTML